MQELFNHYLMKKQEQGRPPKNPKPTKRACTKGIRVQVKRLIYDEGMTMVAVAEKLKVPIRNVRRWHEEGML